MTYNVLMGTLNPTHSPNSADVSVVVNDLCVQLVLHISSAGSECHQGLSGDYWLRPGDSGRHWTDGRQARQQECLCIFYCLGCKVVVNCSVHTQSQQCCVRKLVIVWIFLWNHADFRCICNNSSTCTEVSGVENIGQCGRLSQLSWFLGAL